MPPPAITPEASEAGGDAGTLPQRETTPERSPIPEPPAADVPPHKRPTQDVAASPYLTIHVFTVPSDATAMLDNRPDTACTTPCRLDATPGPHTISIKRSGYETENRTVTVTDTSVELPPVALRVPGGVLMLSSDPTGAKIYVDGSPMDQVTPRKLELKPGKYEITVEKDGRRASKQVEIQNRITQYQKIIMDRLTMNFSRRRLLYLLSLAPGLGLRGDEHAGQNLLIRSANPEDFEMPLSGFDTWITPAEQFYVRTHIYKPKVELAEWRLRVDGLVEHELSLDMAELKKLPRAELTAVMECAGNGRSFYEPGVTGMQWRYGAVGNARWTGVRLGDVLKRAGVKSGATNVLFNGADVPMGKVPDFIRSVPLEKASAPGYPAGVRYEWRAAAILARFPAPPGSLRLGWRFLGQMGH